MAFDAAVKAALDGTSRDDTLVIVTADHSHVMTMSGYSRRASPILGVVEDNDGKPVAAADGKPYSIISYANGPGAAFPALEKDAAEAKPAGVRPMPATADMAATDFLQPSLVPLKDETHSGEDVAIYANGPMAHLFSGTVDQQFMYHAMSQASGLGK
jgi:alkaline phosphatase